MTQGKRPRLWENPLRIRILRWSHGKEFFREECRAAFGHSANNAIKLMALDGTILPVRPGVWIAAASDRQPQGEFVARRDHGCEG